MVIRNRTVSIGLLSAGLGFCFSQVAVLSMWHQPSRVVMGIAFLLILGGILTADMRGRRDPPKPLAEHKREAWGPQPCMECDTPTVGFDENGPLCIDCALVKALKTGE